MFALTPGGAIRKGGGSVVDGPEVVRVTAAVARRAKFLRLEFAEAGEGNERDLICAAFLDHEEVYLQPIPDQEGL